MVGSVVVTVFELLVIVDKFPSFPTYSAANLLKRGEQEEMHEH